MGSYNGDRDEWTMGFQDEPYPSVYDDPWGTGPAHARSRTVSYIVLVDGRVIDSWDEPLVGSPWFNDPRVDRAGRVAPLWRAEPEPPKDTAPWEETIGWLEHLVGSDRALVELTADPLPDEDLMLPEGAVGDADLTSRIRRTGELLDELADRFFDAELRTAFRRGLSAVAVELLGASRPMDPAEAAAGVCWAVGKANGAFHPVGQATQKAITTQLRLGSFQPARGRVVAQLLGSPQPPWVTRPHQLTDLEPLGRPGLLTSRTRGDVVGLRDAAINAEAHAAARERARDCALGLEPGSRAS